MASNYIYIDFSEEGGSYFIAVDQVRYKCSYAESAILAHLLNHKGEYYSKENLASIGWPGKLVSKNSVPVSIANLRKILKNHTQLDIIINEKNKGYVVVDPKILLSEAEAEAEAEAE
ncbi:winged helix-turn-helix domain-containing protein, partial [Vibrio fluvialis]